MKPKVFRRTFILLLMLLLCGCQFLIPRSSLSSLPISPPNTSQEGIIAYQQIEIKKGPNYIRLDAAIKISHNKMDLRLLSEIGQNIARITFGEHGVNINKTSQFTKTPDLKLLSKVVQLAFWPTTALERSFNGTPWSISETPKRRLLTHRGVLASYVDYDKRCPWSETVIFTDPIEKQEFTFKTKLLNRTNTQTANEPYCIKLQDQ